MRVDLRIIPLWALCVVFLFGILEPATFCDQTFTVYGKTAGDPSIIMWELHTGGECLGWAPHALFLYHGRPTVLNGSHAGSSKEWVEAFLRTQQTEEMIPLSGSNDTIYVADSIYFVPPETDSAFTRLWEEEVIHEGSDLPALYRSCRRQDITYLDDPIFYGIEADRIYRYGGGLYKNYSFKEAVYFPHSAYLVVMTHQPLVMPGMDRLDGLLIYRLSDNNSGSE